MLTSYEAGWTMRQARDHYFAVNGFGPDGGYGDAWVDFKLGPLPLPFPNTAGRVQAVRYHDLHHILTGYDTDTLGEFEISAWEIGAGCGDFVAAWQLNLGGLFAGLVSAPRRAFRAFVRGRRGRSLYGEDYDALLDTTVAELRARSGADGPPPRPSATDYVLFGLAAATGFLVGMLVLPVALALLPLGLLNLARKKARSQRTA